MKPIDPQAVDFEYFRASGPGGQHVNKVSTAVRLRYDLERASLPQGVKARLAALAGQRLTQEGVLIIEASNYRSRERNQQEALQRLKALVRQAWRPPRPRKPTRPSRAAQEHRLEQKKQRGQLKRQRHSKDWES